MKGNTITHDEQMWRCEQMIFAVPSVLPTANITLKYTILSYTNCTTFLTYKYSTICSVFRGQIIRTKII